MRERRRRCARLGVRGRTAGEAGGGDGADRDEQRVHHLRPRPARDRIAQSSGYPGKGCQMTDPASEVTALTRDLVQMDSRSRLSNIAMVERIDFTDLTGTAKRVLVAQRGGPNGDGRGGDGKGGLAFSGHLDTVPDTGWQDDPWSGRIDVDGVLHGLGSTDMKGPLAAAVIAARSLPPAVPVSLLITTDEETTKQGAQEIVARSALVRQAAPRGILVVEPTGMAPVRGHRSHIVYTAVATGVQAHSSTGRGRNAN